ncbi:MAG: acyl-CoA synthetase (AMP-forming)/AMP-acid ligase II [Saprospiraceae bacterium]
MTPICTIRQLLNVGADDAIAIQASSRANLTYADLRSLADSTLEALNAAGIGRNDRVAIVLPNGPEMATAFMTIACAATTAPLNPSYRQEEFEFYIDDLKSQALVVERGSESPAVAAAQKLGIDIIELVIDAAEPAGYFTLSAPRSGTATNPGAALTDDVGLILHTSGTTSRPKIVPLSQANICASAVNVKNSLALTTEDACLNVMPLFHIHGLIAAVSATLRAGARIFCSPGFNALRFFSWVEEAKPTWYTAVPTMHQVILQRASRSKDTVATVPFRFIRSSSASLPPQVMAELEKTFGAPVVEAYGMTEAAHQMAVNPLPPGVRKPGSVGLAAGPEVSIMSAGGELLQQGDIGEIVIRGDNVTSGYENNPKANAENFTQGWFRTGDQGVIDEDGYISITGRLKEIINRGGEKISPREVDEILMDHPAVQQCVTFAMPHPKLGEEVAAAVVLVEGKNANENDIRAFTSKHLADFKVPRKILILDEIPKGATGKLQRIGLAEKLGLV